MLHLNLLDDPLFDCSLAIIGGLLTILLAYRVDRNTRRLKTKGIPVEAIVFKIDRQNDIDNDDDRYYPVIRFVTLKGEQITARYRFYFNSGRYNPGDQLKIVYDPDHVNNFLIDDGLNRGFGKIFMVIGAIAVACGIFFAFRYGLI